MNKVIFHGILLIQKQNNGVIVNLVDINHLYWVDPWVWGVTDCWSLVKDWYKEEKNIELRDWDRPTTPEEFILNPLFETCAWRTGFRELRPEEKTMNGDLLFMSIGSPGLNHVAIFLDGDVLHHLTDRLSCREPYSQWLLKCTGGRYRYVA